LTHEEHIKGSCAPGAETVYHAATKTVMKTNTDRLSTSNYVVRDCRLCMNTVGNSKIPRYKDKIAKRKQNILLLVRL